MPIGMLFWGYFCKIRIDFIVRRHIHQPELVSGSHKILMRFRIEFGMTTKTDLSD